MSISVGCLELDVEMARAHGWAELDINLTWAKVSEIARETSRLVAARRGHTRQCPDCECWTVPDGPCHLCEQDEACKANVDTHIALMNLMSCLEMASALYYASRR
jgi:hypothetical protein